MLSLLSGDWGIGDSIDGSLRLVLSGIIGGMRGDDRVEAEILGATAGTMFGDVTTTVLFCVGDLLISGEDRVRSGE